jgi:hypothetical protein
LVAIAFLDILTIAYLSTMLHANEAMRFCVHLVVYISTYHTRGSMFNYLLHSKAIINVGLNLLIINRLSAVCSSCWLVFVICLLMACTRVLLQKLVPFTLGFFCNG